MVFKCQSDSYLKEFVSKVVSCDKVPPDPKKPPKEDQYEVILEDTILFPEGGGQPCDYGFLNSIPVNKVIRKADKAIHITKEGFSLGQEVKQTIDWKRRFDHMQQHSGQHLITALIDKEFEFPTVSWWLGEDVSYIELDTKSITENQIREAEGKINELIRNGKKVTVEVYTKDTPEEELKQVRARGLPEDHKGDIRVINIEDLERNMCCGTHVTNLSQLQMVKLLHSEKSKRKDKTFLYFLVGNRVLDKLSQCIDTERKLTTILKNNSLQHPDLVEKLQKNVKTLTKNLQIANRDAALIIAEKLKNSTTNYFSMFREIGDVDFINTLIRECAKRKDLLLFLGVGDPKTVGNFVLYGPENDVKCLGQEVCNILEGKGALNGNKYFAKANKMLNWDKADAFIKDYLKNE
ncbi:unnamed protein product [Ceutorhynchus assimilis]|uniref:Threonyl/alanyl tRNA synthetase SAD domain-containing protein n=1 Tax=Ceutorhynchus assimilis TaxID=467358 RepID=A0A9N9MER9_9CUCU|nr:unnamed protein product [Ceutorhynchus assimilis]